MKFLWLIYGGLVIASFTGVNSSPVVIKRNTNELSSSANDDRFATDGVDDKDRDKRKIGIVTLGATNGVLNFIFGKLDSFLDAKTGALIALDDANRAKNHAYDIDNRRSALGDFLNHYAIGKSHLSGAGFAPVANSATSFIATASSGLTSAVASKLAPLSSLSSSAVAGITGASGKLSSTSSSGSGHLSSSSGSGHHDNPYGGNSLASKFGSIAGLSAPLSSSSSSGSSGSSSGSSGGGDHGYDAHPEYDPGNHHEIIEDHEPHLIPEIHGHAHQDIDIPSYHHPGLNLNNAVTIRPYDGVKISTTTDDTPIFDRNKVSLDVPPQVFGGGFNLVSSISKVVGSVIMNSAKRTATVLEVFKPAFRGIFAIKGLGSDQDFNSYHQRP